jgi:hypothetical protein
MSASSARVRWAVPKPQKHDFSLKLTRVIEPKGGQGVELATLEDGCPVHGAYAALERHTPALGLCGGAGEADIERATAQMERALRRDNWL